MALTNCTINTQSLTKTGGQAIGSQNVNLTITPDQFHSVTASDFTVGTLPTGVSAITITDTGVPGSFANTLNVLVDLTDTYEMPSANTTLTIDVDGAAVKGERIMQDIFLLEKEEVKSSTNGTVATSAGSGITLSSQTTVGSYKERSATGSKQQGTRVLLFTKTFTAASGYYYPEEPDYRISSSIQDHIALYEVETERTYLDNGSYPMPLQVVRFKVYYNVPNYDVIAGDLDTITFLAETAQLFDPGRKITNVTFDSSNISQRGGTKFINVYGNPGAAYTLAFTDAATTAVAEPTNYANQIISAKGYNSHSFVIPTSYNGSNYTNKVWNITIAAATSNPATTIDYTNIPENVPNYTITQTAAVTLTFTRTTPSGFTPSSPNAIAVTAMPGYIAEDIGETITNFNWSFYIAKQGGGDVFVRRQPQYDEADQNASDLSNSVASSNTGYYLSLQKFEALNSGTSQVTINMKGDADFGNVSKTMDLALGNIINTPPMAYTQSNVNVPNNTATNIALTGTDANGDTLTYSIVSQGTKGTATVNTSTGAAVYTPSNALVSGADSFTYKVNDGFEDSIARAIAVVIASGGSTAPTFNSVWSWDDTEDSNAVALIGSSSFQGTPVYTNASNGATSFDAVFTGWAMDNTHVGVPSYIDNWGDFTINWYFKYQGTTLNEGLANIHQGNSSFNQSAQTADVDIQSVSVSVPNSHNGGNGLINGGGYTFEWRVLYDNILQ
jgi:hypothetical protein